MTNSRHGQMINLIDEMNSPLLAVEPQRCVLVRHRNGECLRCAAVCTTGAISLGEEGIVVSPEKCIGCGMCARSCPAGAINRTDYTAPGHKLASMEIDPAKCVKCGACMSTCKFKAMSKG